jgi:hypothetical protein
MASSAHLGADTIVSFCRAAKLVLFLIALFEASGEQAQQGAVAVPGSSLRGAGSDSFGDHKSAVVEKTVPAGHVAAKALQLGDANEQQLREILAASQQCFGSHKVDTSNIGSLQGTLGSAVGCVEDELEKAWGSQPSIDDYGSQSCGQCEGYGLGSTIIEVGTEEGKWMFVVRLEGSAAAKALSRSRHGHAVVVQQGDATYEQLEVILRATNRCFRRHQVDTSNIGALQGSLGTAVACVQRKCERAWGWRPRVSGEGSHSCGRCEGYGLGATIIAMDGTASGDWMFEMRLK